MCIEEIYVVFPDSCLKITDEGLGSLSQGFRFLFYLQSLTLNLESDNKITSEGLSSLSQGFRSLPSLQNLNLNFEK